MNRLFRLVVSNDAFGHHLGARHFENTKISALPIAPSQAVDVALFQRSHQFCTVTASVTESKTSRSQLVAAIILLATVAYVTPLFVSKPLTSDTVLYDLQAKTVLDGGVAYRDILEPNLPGAIWTHMALRSAIGDSSEAIRIVDLLILGLNLSLLSLWLKRSGVGATARIITATILLLFYVSMSEWCHCQRDSWMLLPALCGLHLRYRHHQLRNQQLQSESTLRQTTFRGFLEGTVWAFAFWLKPFTSIAGLGCLVVSALATNNKNSESKTPKNKSPLVRDIAGVLSGGIFVGVLGIAWLWFTGAWPWLLQTMTEWNPEYFSAGRSRWSLQRLHFMYIRFYPWLLLHLVAAPLAVGQFVQWFRTERGEHDASQTAMLNAFYLGWLFQSIVFQHLMDYIHVPAVLLAATTIVNCRDWSLPTPVRCGAVIMFLWVAVFSSHLIQPTVAARWLSCVTNGSTVANRSVLSDANFPNWNEMEPVIEFLKTQNLEDGDLTCYNVHTIHIYDRLKLKPSTRYVGLSSLITLFPSRQQQFADALQSSGQKLIVTEMVESGLRVSEATATTAEPTSFPPAFPAIAEPTFPWSHPVVFRSGRYLVHRVLPELGNVVGRIPGR